jgi:hypothetical protein
VCATARMSGTAQTALVLDPSVADEELVAA